MMSKQQLLEERRLHAEFAKMFAKAVKPYLPTMKEYDRGTPKELENIVWSIMYTVEGIDKSERKDASKNTWWPTGAYIFIGTDINPNGIDSTHRIARTWNISFEIKGTLRQYRCRNVHPDSTSRKFYNYAESPEEVIDAFIRWIKAEYYAGDFFKKIVPVTIQ